MRLLLLGDVDMKILTKKLIHFLCIPFAGMLALVALTQWAVAENPKLETNEADIFWEEEVKRLTQPSPPCSDSAKPAGWWIQREYGEPEWYQHRVDGLICSRKRYWHWAGNEWGCYGGVEPDGAACRLTREQLEPSKREFLAQAKAQEAVERKEAQVRQDRWEAEKRMEQGRLIGAWILALFALFFMIAYIRAHRPQDAVQKWLIRRRIQRENHSAELERQIRKEMDGD